MAKAEFTCLWQVQESKTHYKTHSTWQAKVLAIGYPPLKSDLCSGAYRNVPWINLRGHWLE